MKKSWQDRAVEALHGNGSRLGTILICALDRNEDGNFPQFSGKASITSDGYIMCNFVDKDGRGHLGAFVGSSEDWCGNVRGLADHLKLNAEERTELFDTMRNWIGVDYRPEHSRGTL